MTWRAFIIGLLAVVLLAVLTPFNDFVVKNTYLTGCHFPAGPFAILLILTLGVNALLKLLRREWALRRAELMLVWCMMIVASTVPASGLMRYWPSMVAAAPYYGARADRAYEKHVLPRVPEDLVLTKQIRSVAHRRFFEGPSAGQKQRIPWRVWARPLVSWGIFILIFYFATFFVTSILRKQWVESERLMFPLARVPMEVVETENEARVLPAAFRNKAFLGGVVASLVFGLIRIWPVIMGGDAGWRPTVPVFSVLYGTPLQHLYIYSGYIYPIAIGIAFLVPADVALSVWLFFLLVHSEMLVAHWMGTPLEGHGPGPFLSWQQAGAFVVFTLMMLWMARRHIWAVVRKAVGAGEDVDDSDEPIGYRLGFWGLIVSVIGMVAWFTYYKMNPFTALGMIALMFCVLLVHARLVAQGGVFFVQQTWNPPQILHGMTAGRAFSQPAAVVAQMQNAILLQDAREILSGHAVNALRISSVFDRHRRWFLPAMMVALVLAMGVCSWSTLRVYYNEGGLNTGNEYGMKNLPTASFDRAHKMIDNPRKSAEPHFGAFAGGAIVMFFVTVMRARFYWWPVHSLGFLIANTWPGQTLWFSFFLAWLLKVGIMKFVGGTGLRKTRHFFLGVIVAEAALVGISAVLGFAGLKVGNLLLPI